MESIERLYNWYKNQCDGDWEHDFGIKIETLDNPGWSITIDLQLTSLQGIEFEFSEENSEFDWYHIKIKDWKYVANGDANKLKFLIDYFLDKIIPQYNNFEYEYQILVPLYGSKTEVWTEGFVKMKNENKFEIIRIDEPSDKTLLSKSFDDVESWFKDLNKE